MNLEVYYISILMMVFFTSKISSKMLHIQLRNSSMQIGRRALHLTAIRGKANHLEVSKAFALGSTPISQALRPVISPIYTAPSNSAISVLKRTCLGFGVIGLYLSELIYSSPTLSSDLGIALAAVSVVPLPMVHYLTQDYVSRIIRLYDRDSTQNLETLTKDEVLLAEKVSFTGRSYYNTLIHVKDLQVVNKRAGWINWETTDGSFYVHDNVGGIRMDRIWGIAEANSGIDNGRHLEK